MTSSKKFLITNLVVTIIYCILGLAFMLVKKLDTVSVILFTCIVLVGAVSSILCWKIMHDENRHINNK